MAAFGLNAEYERKARVAAEIADCAFIAGGLDGTHNELAALRRSDADPVVVAEVERIYHRQCIRELPPQ